MARFAEVYFGSEEDREEFCRWYREEHLTRVDAIKNNPHIKGVQIGLVGIPGIHAIVVIDIEDGHEQEVLDDAGVQEILTRAGTHGMRAGPWVPVAVP